MRDKVLVFAFVILSLGNFVLGQTIYSDPAFPMADESVIVYFNATGTPLESYTEIVYTHTGLKINGSNSWSNVIGSWNNNETQPALTSLGNHLYSLEISPTIREFYSAEATDIIDQMAFVFRVAEAGAQSEDLFLDVYEQALMCPLLLLIKVHILSMPVQSINSNCQCPRVRNNVSLLDDVLINTVAGTSINQNITASNVIQF